MFDTNTNSELFKACLNPVQVEDSSPSLLAFRKIKELLEQGGNPNEVKGFIGHTAMLVALANMSIVLNTIALLIKAGGDVTIIDKNGDTAFHYVCENERVDVDILKLLVENKADPKQVNQYGLTCLHLLLRHGNPNIEAVQFLLEQNVDPNCVEEKESTLGAAIAAMRDLKIIELLVEKGAKLEKNETLFDVNIELASKMKDTGYDKEVKELFEKYNVCDNKVAENFFSDIYTRKKNLIF